MNRRLITSTLGAAAALCASIALAAPATAAPPADLSDALRAATEPVAAATSEAQQRIEDYWTPQRMRAAEPIDQQHQSSTSNSRQSSSTAAATSAKPQFGKVFFTLDGSDHVCSGTATRSTNGDVVTTAGHCVNDGDGTFATKFAFVPAYDNGKAPHGTWTAERLYTPKKWARGGDNNYDAGFAVMRENSAGKSLTTVAGSYGIAFDQDRGLEYRTYGYPAESPYDGERLRTCSGTATSDRYAGNTAQGVECGMTAGSSGGAWITDGKINSVNSYKYGSDADTMYGPYFGTAIENAYRTAANY